LWKRTPITKNQSSVIYMQSAPFASSKITSRHIQIVAKPFLFTYKAVGHLIQVESRGVFFKGTVHTISTNKLNTDGQEQGFLKIEFVMSLFPKEGVRHGKSAPKPTKMDRNPPRSLEDLTECSLYIMLFSRQEPGSYHWGLYLHQDAKVGGIKYHIKGAVGAWIAEYVSTRGALTSLVLIGAMRVAGNWSPGSQATVDSIIREDETRLNDIPGLTCRVFTLNALERLQRRGFATFSNIGAVEQEAIAFANGNVDSCENAQDPQPRPIDFSRVCGMTKA